MARRADVLHRGKPLGLLVAIDQVAGCRYAGEVGRQGQPVAVADDGGVAGLGLGMGVGQPEQPHPEARAEVVGPLSQHAVVRCYNQAVVAAGAGWGLEILARLPGHGLEVEFLFLGLVQVAMLALLVDVVGGHVRFQVALSAGVRLASHLDREGMAGMA